MRFGMIQLHGLLLLVGARVVLHMDTLSLVTPFILRSLSDYSMLFSYPCGNTLEIGAFQNEPKKVGRHEHGQASRLSLPPVDCRPKMKIRRPFCWSGTLVLSKPEVISATVPTANPIWGRRRSAHTCCKSDVRAIFSGNNREAREVHAANCEQRCLVVSGSENWNTCPRVGIAARIATFRLRVARSGDPVRQLAVWQRRLRVPAGARAAVPVCLWPARGASCIRDNTPGRTSRAGNDGFRFDDDQGRSPVYPKLEQPRP